MHSATAAVLFAASSSSSSKSSSASGSASLIILLVIFVAIFWFLVIRPQRNRQRSQQAVTSHLAPGDEVVTIGGMLATVVEVRDDKVVLLVSPGLSGSESQHDRPVEMTFLKQAIARKISTPAASDPFDSGLGAASATGSPAGDDGAGTGDDESAGAAGNGGEPPEGESS